MVIVTYVGPQLGTPEWRGYWMRKSKHDIVFELDQCVGLNARLKEKCEALEELVEALDNAHRQTEMCIRKAAIGMKVTREDNAKYEEYLAQRDQARARLAALGEG